MARLLEEVYVAYHSLITDFVAELNPKLTRDRAAMIALMISAHIDGVMIFRYRAASAMPSTDEKVIAAMKDLWLREIFGPATSPVGGDDRTPFDEVPAARDSKKAEFGGGRNRIAYQSPAPLVAQARRKRRAAT